MKVLGFRADPVSSRYAVVSVENDGYVLLNADTDNRLTIPASISGESEEKHVMWMFNEITHIFEAHPDIIKVMVKTNEYTQQDTKSKRKSAHIESAVMLCSAQKGVPVDLKIYSAMGTSGAETQRHAESRVGRTSKYWDKKMADAVNAAWWGLRQL